MFTGTFKLLRTVGLWIWTCSHIWMNWNMQKFARQCFKHKIFCNWNFVLSGARSVRINANVRSRCFFPMLFRTHSDVKKNLKSILDWYEMCKMVLSFKITLPFHQLSIRIFMIIFSLKCANRIVAIVVGVVVVVLTEGAFLPSSSAWLAASLRQTKLFWLE